MIYRRGKVPPFPIPRPSPGPLLLWWRRCAFIRWLDRLTAIDDWV